MITTTTLVSVPVSALPASGVSGGAILLHRNSSSPVVPSPAPLPTLARGAAYLAGRGESFGPTGRVRVMTEGIRSSWPSTTHGVAGAVCLHDVTDPKFATHSGPPPCSPPG